MVKETGRQRSSDQVCKPEQRNRASCKVRSRLYEEEEMSEINRKYPTDAPMRFTMFAEGGVGVE